MKFSPIQYIRIMISHLLQNMNSKTLLFCHILIFSFFLFGDELKAVESFPTIENCFEKYTEINSYGAELMVTIWKILCLIDGG